MYVSIGTVVCALIVIIVTALLVSQIGGARVFNEWTRRENEWLYVILIVGAVFLRYMVMNFAGTNGEYMWFTLGGVRYTFPCYAELFLVVNLIIPAMAGLSIRANGKMALKKCAGSILFILILVTVYWHRIYAYKYWDDARAVFALVVILATILYMVYAAAEHTGEKEAVTVRFLLEIASAGIVWILVAGKKLRTYGFEECEAEGTFIKLLYNVCEGMGDFAMNLACFIVPFIIMYLLSKFWDFWSEKCVGTCRSLLAFPSVMMLTIRWMYALLMNIGAVPQAAGCFVDLPFCGLYAGYDCLCLGVFLGCVRWEILKREWTERYLLWKEKLFYMEEDEDDVDAEMEEEEE